MASVTRKAKQDRAERQSAVPMKLLRAAETLLARGHAFTEISVEDLIIEAGVARSTFYAHFEDKGTLLLRLADHVTVELEEVASHWYHLPGGSTREDLRAAIGDLMAAHLRHRPTLVAVVEASAYDPGVRAEYEAAMRRRFAEMERGFRAQQLNGGVNAGIDIAQITPWIGWMTERGLFQLLSDGEPSVERHLEGMVEAVWRLLYADNC
jgi:AcrR family transcriptional regulator